ncbi:MAG: AMP-binding protein [Rikenellaceae bacterium]
MELINHTLGSILEYNAANDPDREFLVYPDRDLRFTYATFNERVDKIAKALIYMGVKKDSKVGVWAKNIPDWITYMFATAKVGAVLVTVNTNYKDSELEYIMQNADIHTLCIGKGFRDNNYIETLYRIAPELKTAERAEFKSEKFPELKNVVFMGYEKQKGMYTTAELITLGSSLGDEELERVKTTFNTHDTTNMQYTSGTTGFPKGVMLSHYNILNNGLTAGDCMHYTKEDRLLVCVPMFHCFGAVLALCAIVTHGATMVMVEEFEPLAVLASIAKERCTAVYGVPTMYIAELNHPMFDMFDLTSLRTGIMAGAPCPIETMNQVMEKMHIKDIISVYGLTETSPGMTATRVTDSPEIRATTVGRSFPHVEVKIVDPVTGEDAPYGVQGEVCCRGYNVMKGYYNNPEATAEVIDENGFLHSGDLGVMDEAGYLRITGRSKEMIIRGGENIYPREIENFLYRMPQIEAVEVAGIPSPRYGEQVGAFVKIKEGEKLTEEDIRRYCSDQIARYKIPKYIFFVEGFPMTTSGKIQKYKLKDVAAQMLSERGETIV